MKKISFSDVTLKSANARLSFREKIETAKLLDRLEIGAIELPVIDKVQVDSLLVKSVAAAVRSAAVALPVAWSEEGVDIAWAALQKAGRPRLQLCVPVSPVQMEYSVHKKPAAVEEMITALLTRCCIVCPDVEFVAEDATRAERDFLAKMIGIAAEKGVKTITITDEAGLMLPEEFAEFASGIRAMIPENIRFAVRTASQLGLAEICAAKAAKAGADEVKVCVYGECANIQGLTHLMTTRPDVADAAPAIRTTELVRVSNIICAMNTAEGKNTRDNGIQADTARLVGEIGAEDDLTAVTEAVRRLGYDLSEEDYAHIFDSVQQVTRNKKINAKELDAIVAGTALQVPPTYKLVKFVVNSGNVIGATAQIEMVKEGETLKGVAMGDGPVDAAFQTIEQIVGRHFELDDFQIQSVTEGRESVGDALIRLRSSGKLYSGRGISTDIIGASIRAYVSALNKIVYEEA
ncbi:MAG: hypothetical protein HUJ69_05910 [Lachnospiraceae bacterium]|nr:hypothetical protein [Lachnospiraceae bacterium]